MCGLGGIELDGIDTGAERRNRDECLTASGGQCCLEDARA